MFSVIIITIKRHIFHLKVNYIKGIKEDFSLEVNLVEYLLNSDWESDKDKDLKKIFWTSNKTRPIPNSTADSTKKKKVKDKRFRLS